MSKLWQMVRFAGGLAFFVIASVAAMVCFVGMFQVAEDVGIVLCFKFLLGAVVTTGWVLAIHIWVNTWRDGEAKTNAQDFVGNSTWWRFGLVMGLSLGSLGLADQLWTAQEWHKLAVMAGVEFVFVALLMAPEWSRRWNKASNRVDFLAANSDSQDLFNQVQAKLSDTDAYLGKLANDVDLRMAELERKSKRYGNDIGFSNEAVVKLEGLVRDLKAAQDVLEDDRNLDGQIITTHTDRIDRLCAAVFANPGLLGKDNCPEERPYLHERVAQLEENDND